MNYLIGDFLIRIKNARLAGGREVRVRKTHYLWEVAKALERMGLIEKLILSGKDMGLTISSKDKEPLFTNLKLVTKPGLRVYKSAEDLRKYRGPASFLLSTPRGVLSSSEAVKENVGGEVIVEII